MSRRSRRLLLLLAVLVALLLGARKANLIPRFGSLASLLNPVFHKETIQRYSDLYGEDPLLVMAIIKVESKFFTKAKSHRGAIGLMQIMPLTAREIATELKINTFADSDLEKPDINIQFGLHYLSKLRKEFGRDNLTVLGAYNAGQKNVKEWLKENNRKNLLIEDIQFSETKKFTREVLFTYAWLKRLQSWQSRVKK